jgi:hypothetical protein
MCANVYKILSLKHETYMAIHQQTLCQLLYIDVLCVLNVFVVSMFCSLEKNKETSGKIFQRLCRNQEPGYP